jgi:hypothetical protein
MLRCTMQAAIHTISAIMNFVDEKNALRLRARIAAVRIVP